MGAVNRDGRFALIWKSRSDHMYFTVFWLCAPRQALFWMPGDSLFSLFCTLRLWQGPPGIPWDPRGHRFDPGGLSSEALGD